MSTWGSLTLNVLEWNRPGNEINIKEHKLIPDPSGGGPQSVIIGEGRLRGRITLQLLQTDAEFQSLGGDKNALTTRALDLTDIEANGIDWSEGIIIDLKGVKRKGAGFNGKTICTITFMEVTI